jgi:hypothetical protein
MVGEKINAAVQAGAIIMSDSALELVVERYREQVAANLSRLQLS